jgi:hypothetical protein
MRSEPAPTRDSDFNVDFADDDVNWEPLPDSVNQDDTIVCAIRDFLDNPYVYHLFPLVNCHKPQSNRWAKRRYKDARSWRNRLDSLESNWSPLIPALVDAFIKWKSHKCTADSVADEADPEYSFTIRVVDIFTLLPSVTIHRSATSTSAAESLMAQGYLANTPVDPSCAVSLRTLEHFRLLRCRKPSLSTEAFAKVLCDSYAVCFKSFVMLYLLT